MDVIDTDVAVIGSGMGGAVLARTLGERGIRTCVLERGTRLPREADNWSPHRVFVDHAYRNAGTWRDAAGRAFTTGVHYWVGGNTKVYGGSLVRFREQDFGEVRYREGVSPAWPFGYATLEPYYAEAERWFGVHGTPGADPCADPRLPSPAGYRSRLATAFWPAAGPLSTEEKPVVTMSAAVLRTVGALAVEPRPAPAVTHPDDVLIRVRACGICGTDLHILADPPGYPARQGVILGHEIVGDVAGTGPAVTTVAVGDRVAIRPILTCGTCRECLSGRPNHCGHRQDLGVWRDGGLAERLVVPASACLKLSDRIPLPVAALTEPLACVLNAVRRIRPAAGERTVVLGAGAIGLLFTAVLTAHGAAPVVVEPSPSRAAAARALGALDVIDPRAYSRPSPADADGKACADGTAGAGAGAGASADTAAGADAAAGADTALGAVVGADIVIDAVGSQLDVAVAMAAPRARIMLFGLNDHSRPAVPQAQITLKELTVLGSFVGQHTFPEAVRLLESGLLDLTPIISHQVDLADLPDLLPALRAGEVIKAVVRIPAE